MIKEIEAKSLLRYNKRPSYWFGVHYYINIYRGCTHGCIYCDTRSECYGIDNFDSDLEVKINTIELLRKEIAKKRYRETIGFGSTSDPYIPLELKYELTRKSLMVIKEYRHPVFLLTKSNLVIRDLDLLCDINDQNYACVCFTITTANDELAKKIEPNAPLPSKRFEAMSILAAAGIKTGIIIMPMLPFITDSVNNLTEIVEQANKCGASFIFPSYSVTLRDRQRQYFYDKIGPDLVKKYHSRYKEYYSCGTPNYAVLKRHFNDLCQKYNISMEMPSYDKENAKVQLNLFTNEKENL